MKQMKLHKEVKIDENTLVRRVINGWVYTELVWNPEDQSDSRGSSVFVPLVEVDAFLSARV